MGLLDALRPARQPAPTDTVGVPGFVVLYGVIDNRERDATLRGAEKWRTYTELLVNIAIVAAGVRYFLNLVSHGGWNFEAADPSNPEAVEIAKAVDAIVNDMETPWPRVVRRAAMYRFYGFSVQEWTAKRRDDGTTGLFDVAPRPCHTIAKWDTDETGRVVGIVQQDPKSFREIYLPRGKVVYVCDDSIADSPEGLGLLRHLVEPAARLKRLQDLEMVGFDTELRGVPKLFAPLAELQSLVRRGQLSDADKEAVLAPLKEFMENHVRGRETAIMLDSDTFASVDPSVPPSGVRKYDIDLLQGSGNGQAEANAAIDRIAREMATVLGVEGLLLGGSKTGAYALAEDKSHNFYLILDSTLNELAWTFKRDLVDTIVELNGWPPELAPKAVPDKASIQDVEKVARTLAALAQAGAVLDPSDPAINVLRKRLSLPPAPDPAKDAGLRRTLDDIDKLFGDAGAAGGGPPSADPDDPNALPEPPDPEGSGGGE